MDCNEEFPGRKKARQLAALDKAHNWHPFTQMLDWCAGDHEPLVIEEGKGAVLVDCEGHEYIDGNSSIWTNLHGHCHPMIDGAIRAQLDKMAHVSFLGATHEPACLLASSLSALFPGQTLPRVFFSDDGSTAVEVALKMSLQFFQQTNEPGRKHFVAFDQAYHGDTSGAASLGGVSVFHDRFSGLHFPVLRVRSVEEFASLRELGEGSVAAVIIEPKVQAVAGIRLWPDGMLRDLRRVCDRHGVLLILDEIMTGFGRTGCMFACEHEEVIPDFLCLAKGLTGGYLPLAATLTTERIFSAFLGRYEELKSFFYGHSYTANALGCAAALANLRIFKEEKTLERIAQKIPKMQSSLQLLQKSRHISGIRQIGFVAGIDIARPDGTPYPWQNETGARVCQAARKYGLLTRPIRDTIVLMPPYCITDAQLDHCVGAIDRAMREVLGA
jgi:adenosylmethionine-8-amino-7-oxononanoate aminotransferase